MLIKKDLLLYPKICHSGDSNKFIENTVCWIIFLIYTKYNFSSKGSQTKRCIYSRQTALILRSPWKGSTVTSTQSPQLQPQLVFIRKRQVVINSTNFKLSPKSIPKHKVKLPHNLQLPKLIPIKKNHKISFHLHIPTHLFSKKLP